MAEDEPTYTEIAYEVDDGILTLTMDRPEKLNAFTVTMQREMTDAFRRANRDDDIRVIIVTGRGRGFCAGADLSMGAATFDAPAAAKSAGVTDEAVAKATGSRSRYPRDFGGLLT